MYNLDHMDRPIVYKHDTDRPINSISKDKFQRATFSKDLATALMSLAGIDSFCVGLLGEWGSGKTSIINMTLDYIDKEYQNKYNETQFIIDEINKNRKWYNKRKGRIENKNELPIVFRFNPWFFQDETQLFNQFFLEFVTLLKGNTNEYIQMIADLIDEYGGLIELTRYIPTYGEIIEIIGKSTLNGLSKQLKGTNYSDKSILEQKRIIEEKLSKINTKIIIVIDDIDRLSNEQIRCVFQLIKSVCDFPNTIYLVAFDRDIVVKALEQVQDCDGELYLEKVIQVPITIPPLSVDSFTHVFEEKLFILGLLYKIYSNSNDSFSYSQIPVFKSCIYRIINTVRSAKRLLNLLEVKLASIGENIDYIDLILLTALELEEPKIFEWIKHNKDLLTGKTQYSKNITVNHNVNSLNKGIDLFRSNINKEISNLIEVSKHKDSFNETLLLETLFETFPLLKDHYNGTSTINENELLIKNRIAHPLKFNRYFTLSFDRSDLETEKISLLIKNAKIDALNEPNFHFNSYSNINDVFDIIINNRNNIELENCLDLAEYIINTVEDFYFDSKAQATIYELLKSIDINELNTFFLRIINNLEVKNINSIVALMLFIGKDFEELSIENNQKSNSFSKIIEDYIYYRVRSKIIDRNNFIIDGMINDIIDERISTIPSLGGLINESIFSILKTSFLEKAKSLINFNDLPSFCDSDSIIVLCSYLDLLIVLDPVYAQEYIRKLFQILSDGTCPDYYIVFEFLRSCYSIHSIKDEHMVESYAYLRLIDFSKYINEKTIEKAIGSYFYDLFFESYKGKKYLETIAIYELDITNNSKEYETVTKKAIDSIISKMIKKNPPDEDFIQFSNSNNR